MFNTGSAFAQPSRRLSPSSSRAHISIDDNPAQQFVAATRPSLSRTHTPTSLAGFTMSQTNSLNARYERALQETQPSHPITSSSIDQPAPSNPEQPKIINKVDSTPMSDASTESDSHFDWDESDESELDEQEKEMRQMEKTREITERHEHHIKRAKRLRKVYLTLMRLSRPIRTALFLIIGTGTAITPALVLLLRYPHSRLLLPVLAWSIWISICVAGSCIISIMVDFLPILVLKLFFLLYGSTPEKLKTQVELWMSVNFWIKLALSLTCYWVSLLVMFTSAFPFAQDSRLSYFNWITKIACALFATGLALLFEKIVLQIIKLNFHRTSLKDRLLENEKALWALDKLAAAKDVHHVPKRKSGFLSGFVTTRRSHDGTGRNTPGGKRTARNSFTGTRNPEGVSSAVDLPPTPLTPATPGARHRPTSSEGGVLPSNLEKELRHAKNGKKSFRRISGNLQNAADQLASALASATLKDGGKKKDELGSSTHSAKKLARKLFEGLDEDRGGVLTRNEFEPYFKNAVDAAEAFKLFDKDGNGDIDKKEMRNAVSRIYRERKALATSLKDMSSAVGKLDAVLLAMSFVIVIFIWLLIFNPTGTASQFVPMATIILGFSFIFGNAAKNLFESMLFIFSIHPYDVGDLVFIDDSPLYVLEFGLFSTTFQRVDGQVMVAPNSILSSQKYILNVRRSGSMWETTNIMVGFDTPLEVLHEFRTRMRLYVNDNPREWKGGHVAFRRPMLGCLDVNIDYMKNQNLIQLIIAMEHKGNWQDWGARWDRRTLLMREMKKILDQLNIIYKLPIQPVSFVTPPTSAGRRPLRDQGSKIPGNRRGVGGNLFERRGGGGRGGGSESQQALGSHSQPRWNTSSSLSGLRVQTTTS